jgi:hypothetical protein
MRPKGIMRVGGKKLKPLAEGFPKAKIQALFLFAVIVKLSKMCQKAAFGLHLTGQVLLHVGYFITSSPELLPN